jgi:hypothetical protein
LPSGWHLVSAAGTGRDSTISSNGFDGFVEAEAQPFQPVVASSWFAPRDSFVYPGGEYALNLAAAAVPVHQNVAAAAV